MTPGPDPYASDGVRRRNTIIASVAAALVVGAIAGIGGMRLLAATRETPKPVLAKNAELPPPTLAKTAQAPPPVLDATADKKVMPADVRAWLEHLERIERKREELANRGVAELRVMLAGMSGGASLEALKNAVKGTEDPMNTPDVQPSPAVSNNAEKKRQEWDQLLNEYNSVIPPLRCRNLADTYRSALREAGAMTVDVLSIFEGAQQGSSDDAMSAVAKLQGILDKKQTHRIDAYGRDSDRELGVICAEFQTRKWFSIKEDFGGQGLLNSWAGTSQ